MISLRNLFVGLTLTLAGCTKKDQVIVDLSGGVFIAFIFLALLKYSMPVIVNSELIKRFSLLLQKKVRFLIFPLYVIAICFIVAGFSLGGIHKVLVFSGFVVAITAVFLGKYSAHEKKEDKKRMLEIVFLGAGFLTILSLMWLFGEVMFSVF